MNKTPWWQRDDVNSVAFVIVLLLVILAITAVPPEWYPQ